MFLARLRTAVKISRPRFWLYLAGPWLVGWALGMAHMGVGGAEDFLPLRGCPSFWMGLFFFLIPANFFLYGVNDFFDADTDAFNAKKGDKEILLAEADRGRLRIALLITMAVSVGYYLTLHAWQAKLLFVAFFALSFFYSAQPFRFKARPVLDSASNILYGLPGILAYYVSVSMNGGARHAVPLPRVPVWVWMAVALWTAAMHLFSAIPDIEADQKAGLATTATLLGKRKALLLCFGLWLNMAFLLLTNTFETRLGSSLPGIVAFGYPMIPMVILLRPDVDINRVYWAFPYINGFLGFGLFGWAVFY